MMWLTTILGIIWFSQGACNYTTWRQVPVRYVDFRSRQDLYFDRIVALSLRRREIALNYGIGVHISSDRILTSFNPFRIIIRDETMFKELLAISLIGRNVHNRTMSYTLSRNHLACARQIQDLPDEVITEGDLWHGPGNRHCPLHDLLVFRIYNDLEVSTVETKDHDMKQWPAGENTTIVFNIFLTKLAVPDERIGDNFKFCAFVDGYLNVTSYTADDEALVDCEEWLPRAWGYFFCIRNKNKYRTVSSGAMLVSKEKLFGVASFVLTRGEESIIVFTDIRPYYDLIQNTCTYSDSEEKRPGHFPSFTYEGYSINT